MEQASDIRGELEDLEVPNFEQKPFIPLNALKLLLQKERVTTLIHALSENGKIEVWQESELIHIIVDNGLRVFATLLSFARPELIQKFKETDHFTHSNLDSRLPLSKDSLTLILGEERSSAKFYKHQWRFLVPFFRADQSHRELQDNVVLPFTECERLAEGGFGEVHRMTIDATHQGLVPAQTGKVRVVRKQIKSRKSAQKDFRQEEQILSFLRCLEHPNIVRLLTAYTIHQSHYFLFPLADGDLKQFMRQEDRVPGFETESEVLQALYELASAIEAVHNYFSNTFSIRKIGCHYDLKPDNILYHSGKFILSDFGLSRLRNEEEGSESLYKNGGAEYWAPECHSVDEDFKKLPVGRSSDMWSFGCILSEILTYLQEGPAGVRNFSDVRTVILGGYFECKLFHEGAEPSTKVTRWLSRLKNCPVFTSSQRSLMVIVNDLLQHEPHARSKAQDITLSLFHIVQTEIHGTIEKKFQEFPIGSNLEIDIECERFRIWGERSEVGDLEHVLKIDGRRAPMKFADMQLVLNCLFKLRQEVDRVSLVLKDGGQKPYRVCYHLQKVIDSLWDLQPSSVRESMTNILETRILSIDTRNDLKSMEGISQRNDANDSDESSEAYRRIGLLATMKQIALALEDRRKSSGDMLIDQERITRPLRDFHWHKIGKLHSGDGSEVQVLIESLKYEGSWVNRMDELVQRVQDISSFRGVLSTSHAFPILTSAGYYHDIEKHSFGIVYYFPPRPPAPSLSVPEIERPISLWDIISKIKSRTQRPSLDQVFGTAKKLLSVVLTMHKASWLHKNISSYNIIFFPNRFNSIAEAMSEPYFIGFSYARVNSDTSFTQGPDNQLEYQHPEYQYGRKRFCQEYEYYSVGLVLLELGFWSPLEMITKDIRGSPTEMRDVLLEKVVPKLKTYMGRAYEMAVATCLRGEFGGSSSPAQVREAFERIVLPKIGGIT